MSSDQLGLGKRLLAAAQQDTKSVAQHTSAAVREFVGDMLGRQGKALTAREVEEALTAAQMEAEQIGRVKDLIAQCENAQYGMSDLSVTELPSEGAKLVAMLTKDLR